MKKILGVTLLAGLFFPLISFGAYNAYQENGKTVIYDGLVPCGKEVCVYNSTNPELVNDFLKFLKKFDIDNPEFTFEKNCGALGGEWKTPPTQCEFCHLFIASNNLIQFFMLRIVPLAAVLMLVIGGVMFLLGGYKTSWIDQAKGIITAVVVGVIIILAAWVAVNTLFDKSGIIKTDGWKWYEIQCSAKL